MTHQVAGHASLFRDTHPVASAIPPLDLIPLHQKLKKAFDPYGIFNPGVLGVPY